MERGGLDPAADQPLLAHGQFVLQDQFQELGMVELMPGRLLQPHLERLGQAGQAQLFQSGLQAFIHDGLLLVRGG